MTLGGFFSLASLSSRITPPLTHNVYFRQAIEAWDPTNIEFISEIRSIGRNFVLTL
jgi:hypothetical protein